MLQKIATSHLHGWFAHDKAGHVLFPFNLFIFHSAQAHPSTNVLGKNRSIIQNPVELQNPSII